VKNMTGFDFKVRFISALPFVPPELDLRLDEFVVFEAGRSFASTMISITSACSSILR